MTFLQQDIAKKPDDASIKVILFQDKCLNRFSYQNKNNFNWREVKNGISANIKNVTNTNIVDAWKEWMSSVNPNSYNIIYLLTDGKDNHVSGRDCVADLCDLIRSSCGTKGNVQLLYVMLTEFAQDKRINDAIASCPDFSVIDDIGPNFVLLGKRTFRMNAHDSKVTVSIPVSDKNPFPVTAQSASKLFKVEVVGGQAQNGIVKLQVSRVIPERQLRGKPESLDFTIKLKSQSKDAWIINPCIDAEVLNKPEKSLTIAGGESGTDLGKSLYYPSFLFVGECGPEPIEYSLAPVFNDDAKRANALVTFKISSDVRSDNDYRVLVNGKEIPNHTFTIAGNDSARLTIIFNKDAATGKRHFVIEPVCWNGIDKINGEVPQNFKFVPYAKYSKSMNPLELGLICFLIIVIGVLIIWFAVLKRMVYPVFRGINGYTITAPFFSTKRFKGCRKIILTDSIPTRRQGALSRLFTGEVRYDVNPVWTKPIEITPYKKTAHIDTGANYLVTSTNGMMPPNNIKKGGEYLIEPVGGNEKIKLMGI